MLQIVDLLCIIHIYAMFSRAIHSRTMFSTNTCTLRINLVCYLCWNSHCTVHEIKLNQIDHY